MHYPHRVTEYVENNNLQLWQMLMEDIIALTGMAICIINDSRLFGLIRKTNNSGTKMESSGRESDSYKFVRQEETIH